MSEVTLDSTGLTAVINQYVANAGQLEPVAQQIAAMLVAAVDEEWDSGGHGQWEQLKQSTLDNRRREGRGAKILEDTGVAAGSVMPAYGSDYASAYTNVPYMIFHTSDQPRTIIPYRNPFDFDPENVLDRSAEMILARLVR